MAHSRLRRSITVLGILAAVTLPASAGYSHGRTELTLVKNLACEGHLNIAYANPVTNTAAVNSFTATGSLEDCYSPSGANPNITHASVTLAGSGTLGCTGQHSYTGTAIYTWYDGSGSIVGKSTVDASGMGVGDAADDEDANVQRGTARLASTRFALQSFQGGFEPLSSTGTCTTGLTALAGSADLVVFTGVSLTDNLVCEGRGTVTFTHPITNTLAANSFTSTGDMRDCFSPSGANPSIVRGTVTTTGNGTLDCTHQDTFSGTAVYTWYDASGNVVGTSTVNATGSGRGDAGDDDVANAETGTATAASSRFALQTFQGSFAPTSSVGTCAGSGITSLTGVLDLDVATA